MHVPLAVLPRLRPDGFDWLAPGSLPELATATIRALPKPVRVQLVPAPDTARAALDHLPAWSEVAPAPDGAPSFAEAFRAALLAVRPNADIPKDAFDDVPESFPAHLRMTFRVVGERGAVLEESTNLPYLQRRLAAQSQSAVQSAVRRALRHASRQSDESAAAKDVGATRMEEEALGLPSAPLVPRGAPARPTTSFATSSSTRSAGLIGGLTTHEAVGGPGPELGCTQGSVDSSGGVDGGRGARGQGVPRAGRRAARWRALRGAAGSSRRRAR